MATILIHVQRHWWLSWSEFYPDTSLWEPALRPGSASWTSARRAIAARMLGFEP